MVRLPRRAGPTLTVARPPHRRRQLTAFAPQRRRALRAAFALLLALPALAQAFAFDDVSERARRLAAAGYQRPPEALPRELRELDYDGYRDIRFKPERAVWRADRLPFELMLFHQGRGFKEPVRVNIVDGGRVQPLAFDPSMFDYGRNRLDAQALRSLGFAGFRVHYPINRRGYKDEALVFLGASYFRAVGRGQNYGASARGLAVDTAEPKGEEFPRFTEFWIERPRPTATALVIHALLDSPRLAGAYRFVLAPGEQTVLDVQARLFLREGVDKVGLAPLTSMYAFGENQPGRDDYRPEVHDSDGLAIHTSSGEWIWRPLVNPQRLLVTSFSMRDPKGFGLLQRDRAYPSYEDSEAVYETRPSVWIEPAGRWGEGRVELVQIPSPDETNDNIVAYWVPKEPPEPRRPYAYAYRMRWHQQGVGPTPLAAVLQTRRGRGYVKQPDGDVKFVVDFDGPALRALKADARPEAAVSIGGNGELRERNLYRNRVTGGWRMTVRLRRIDAARPVELRAVLREGAGETSTALSETWSYILPPEPDRP